MTMTAADRIAAAADLSDRAARLVVSDAYEDEGDLVTAEYLRSLSPAVATGYFPGVGWVEG